MHPPHLQQLSKEVNSVVIRLPKGAVCCRADAGLVSAFCDFRMEVL